MRIGRQGKYRGSLIVIIIILISNSVLSQIESNELFSILDLYVDGQYEVALSKLSNNNFKLDKTTPNHTLDKTEYKGDFQLTQSFHCPNSLAGELALKNYMIPGFISFKTENRVSDTQIYIEFRVYMLNAKYVFKQKILQWQKEFKNEVFTDVELESRNSAYAKDTTTCWSVDGENPRSLVYNNKERAYFRLEHNTVAPSSLCTWGYSTLSGILAYNIPKYIVQNPHEYFTNLADNNTKITVPVKKQGNVYLVEITIGGQNLIYMIDSGASEMIISSAIEKKLLEMGIIRNSDYLPSQRFTFADGRSQEFRRVKLAVVKIGPIKVENVEAAIGNEDGILLLGKSFLDKFKYWKINNDNQTLELQY